MVKVSSVLVMLLLTISFSSAVLFDNDQLPIVKPLPTSFPTNTTINVSVNSSHYWDTSDHGALGAVSDLYHNWLSGLQGGSVAGYFHLNSTQWNLIEADLFNFVTLNQLNNIHNQDLNTTDNVTFNGVNISCGGLQGANESCLNVSGDAYFRDIHARDVYVSNNTLYIGDTVSLSANGVTGSVLNISGGNVSVGSTGYYFGSGQYLTDINLTGISFNGGNITANIFNGSAFYGGNFYGVFNWTATPLWLDFNGTNLEFNESHFNNTVQELAEVTLRESVTNLVSSGGSASATTALLDFEIKEIIVNTTSGTKFRFEAVGAVSGNIIDKDRVLHDTLWDIEKNYAINEPVNISITATNPSSDSFTVIIKYLNNFN